MVSRLSDSVILVWHVAAFEAGAARHPDIHPGHFTIALAKVVDLPLQEVVAGLGGADDACIATLERDVGEIGALFAAASVDAVRLRRAIRQELGQGSGRPADGVRMWP